MSIRLLSSVCLLVWATAVSGVWAFAADAPQGVKMLENGVVSLDFQDADIKNVLKVLAFKSGVNIVAAPDVTGVVTIQLNDVPWQKALDVILSTYGYGFERKGNIITVMTVENLKKYREDATALQAQEPLVSKTFVLSFAKAAEVMKIIEKMKSPRGFINFDDRTNAVIVRDLESNVELIAEVVKSIDTVTPQVMIETKIIETDLSNTENLGVDWVVQAAMTGAEQPTIFPFTQNGGIFKDGGSGSFFPAATSFKNFVASTPPTLASASAPRGFTYGTIDASQLSAILQILNQRSHTKILSDPRIVTLDNKKAKFNVGIQYPMAQYQFNSNTGALQVNGVTFLPIGINFDVTPHVNNTGLVTLDVHPQISALKTTITLDNTAFPETSNEEAETNVMVESGKTLVIAGLITDQTTTTKIKVPLLGDIPFVGDFLFKNTNTVKTRQEILIFLTPHVITVNTKSAPAAVQ